MVKKDRLVKTFLELVKIDSPSGHEDAVAKNLTERLSKLGFKVTTDSFGNLIAKLPGKGKPFMLNAHMDTVEPGRGIKPKVTSTKITSDGTTILGGDDKSGLSIILETLKHLKVQGKKLPSLEVVITRGEETGLLGAINLDFKKVSSKKGVTFDGMGKVTNLTVSAPGYNRVDVTVIGRGAHAGVEPEKGISAIKIASEIILDLKVGRIDEETTANIGLITGGTARNAVPETAMFKAEIRSRDKSKLQKHADHFQDIFRKAALKHRDAKIQAEIVKEFSSYLFTKSHPLIQDLLKVYKKLGLKPVLGPTGGGSDVNIFNGHGIQIVDVGIGVYNPHTKKEYVDIKEMVEAANFLETLILSL